MAFSPNPDRDRMQCAQCGFWGYLSEGDDGRWRCPRGHLDILGLSHQRRSIYEIEGLDDDRDFVPAPVRVDDDAAIPF